MLVALRAFRWSDAEVKAGQKFTAPLKDRERQKLLDTRFVRDVPEPTGKAKG